MYYVILMDQHGHSYSVKHFKTRPEAIEYIINLPDEHYKVILRNDNLIQYALSLE